MKQEEIAFLSQLVRALEDGGKDLEKSYLKGDYNGFNSSKKIMSRIQKEISDIINSDAMK